MSEENKPAGEGTAAPTDELKNIKGEFNRKLSNYEQQLSELKKANEALLSKLNPPKATQEPSKLDDVWFDKPEEAARQIEERTYQRVKAEMSQQQAVQAKQQAVLNQLVTDFPELGQSDHELTQKAVEIFNAMADEDKTTPVAYRAAVKEAALELGIKPKSKRSASDGDSFALGGSSASPRSSKSAKAEIDQATLMFAEAVGLKLDDKTKERLKKNHGRKSYTNWG